MLRNCPFCNCEIEEEANVDFEAGGMYAFGCHDKDCAFRSISIDPSESWNKIAVAIATLRVRAEKWEKKSDMPPDACTVQATCDMDGSIHTWAKLARTRLTGEGHFTAIAHPLSRWTSKQPGEFDLAFGFSPQPGETHEVTITHKLLTTETPEEGAI